MKSLTEILESKKGTYHNYALDIIQEAVQEWLEQDIGEKNYLTAEEMGMQTKEVNQQVALGLRSCKTIGDVCRLLQDVRRHERYILFKAINSKNRMQ